MSTVISMHQLALYVKQLIKIMLILFTDSYKFKIKNCNYMHIKSYKHIKWS